MRLQVDPCRPLHPLPVCTACDRHRPELPHNPDMRPHTVLMDVTTILREGSGCPMFVSRPVARYWWNNEAETVAA